MIKLISDGTSFGTCIEIDGEKMKGVLKIEIPPIDRDSFPIVAKVTVILDEINIELDSIERVE